MDFVTFLPTHFVPYLGYQAIEQLNFTSVYAKTSSLDAAVSYRAIRTKPSLDSYFCRTRSIHHQNFYHQLTRHKLITDLDHYFPKYYVDWKCKFCICHPGRINEHNHCLAGSSNHRKLYYAPRPAKQSKVGQGAFYFFPYSDLYQVTTVPLFKVTIFNAHISSIGSHFLTARVLVY